METRRTPLNLRFYAGEATRLPGRHSRRGPYLVYTLREPVGVVAAITPWNFPLNIPSRKLGPALAAGNGVVFKPCELTPLMGQRLVEALLEAGLPPGDRPGARRRRGRAAVVADDPRVGGHVHRVTPVGRRSTPGRPAAPASWRWAARTRSWWPRRDLDRAAALIVRGAFGLSGQACTGTSRVIADDAVHDELVERLVAAAEAQRVGPGLQPGVDMGPLASAAQLDKFLDYVAVGGAEGAGCAAAVPPAASAGPGWLLRPARGVHRRAADCAWSRGGVRAGARLPAGRLIRRGGHACQRHGVRAVGGHRHQ